MMKKLFALLACLITLGAPVLAGNCASAGVADNPNWSGLSNPTIEKNYERVTFGISWTKCFNNQTFTGVYLELNGANLTMTAGTPAGQTTPYTYTADIGVEGLQSWRYFAGVNSTGYQNVTGTYTDYADRYFEGILPIWSTIVTIMVGLAALGIVWWQSAPLRHGQFTLENLQRVIFVIIAAIIVFAFVGAIATL